MQSYENNISTDEIVNILNNIQQEQEEQQTEIQHQQEEIQQQLEDLSTTAPTEEQQEQQRQEEITTQEILHNINDNLIITNNVLCGSLFIFGVLVGVLLFKIFMDRFRNI